MTARSDNGPAAVPEVVRRTVSERADSGKAVRATAPRTSHVTLAVYGARDPVALYATACGWTLARAHARSGDAVAIASYPGRGDSFDRALRRFASDYADLNEGDHRAFAEAVAAGKLEATAGI